MQKRGLGRRADVDPTHHLYLFLFELVLLALVTVSLLGYVKSIEKNYIIQKTYLSKDLALLTSVVMASPGNINYVYAHPKVDLSTFRFDFDKAVTVVETGMEYVGKPIYYPFTLDKSVAFQPVSLSNPGSILFSLQGKELRVAKSTIEASMVCQNIVVTDSPGKIVVDPGHGVDLRDGSSTHMLGAGYEVNGLVEQNINKYVAASLKSQLAKYDVVLSRQGDEFVSDDDRKNLASAKDVSLVVSLHSGCDYSEQFDSVRAYVYSYSQNMIRSEYFACLALKEFAKLPDVKKVELVKVTQASESVLDTGNVAVLFEIGNICFDSVLLKKPYPELSQPIAKAVGLYYGH
ncbi:MAG: N-acetylmuramoyl-L-alanine amidase [Candidatus Woesearchaeota archaeon]